MQYNTTLPHIIVPEYGRNIQRMIEFACTVGDKEERNLIARSIVKVMGQVNVQYKDSEDFLISFLQFDAQKNLKFPIKLVLYLLQ